MAEQAQVKELLRRHEPMLRQGQNHSAKAKSGVYIVFQPFPQFASCSEKKAFHRGHGGSKDFGYFLVGHVLKTPQHNSHALHLRQRGNGTGNGFLQFRFGNFFRSRARRGVSMINGRPVAVVRFQRNKPGPVAAAHFIENKVSRDGQEPGGEFGRRVVTRGTLPDADEDLLGDILGVRIPTEHFCDSTDHAELVALHQSLKSRFIPLLHSKHEGNIVRRSAIIRVYILNHLPGKETGLNHAKARKAREIPLAVRVGIGFLCQPMTRPLVASYCTTFLKREMRHIYRQVSGLKDFETFVITRSRENKEEYPFPDVEALSRPRIFFLLRFYKKYLAGEEALFYRGEYKQLTTLLERRKPDLIHVYFGHTGVHLLPFIRAWKGRSLVSFHGMDIMPREEEPGYSDRLRDLLKTLPMVLARSESLASRLVDLGCAPEKIRINRTGIPLERFPYIERTPPADGAWHIVQASRLIEKKGLDNTLEAFASFHKNHPLARLTLAGDGPLWEQLTKKTAELGIEKAVHFAGFQSQEALAAIYASAHIFMHPSRLTAKQDQEGVPNSMLEAMATGLPVVATLHGGIPEAVENGTDGLLTPENDSPALAASLECLAKDADLFHRLGSNAANSVRRKYEQSAAIRALEGFYRELIEEQPCE